MEEPASVRTWVTGRRFACLFYCAIVLGHPLEAQDLRTRLEDFEQQDISLWAQSEPGGWVEESSQELARYKRGRSFRSYLVYYGYNESALSPRSSENSYLHLFIVDLAQPAGLAARTTRAWYQRYQLNVEGDFIDRDVNLDLSIIRGSSVDRGTLRVTVHQAWPVSLVQPKYQDVKTIDLRTNVSRTDGVPIEFANRSRCCEIRFKEGRVVRWDKDLWDDLKVTALNGVLQPGGEGVFQEWLSLGLEPKRSGAFWRSFSLFEDTDPYSELTLEVAFQVQGGREARLLQKVWVRFKPPWPLVLLSVILGASLTSSLNLLYKKLRRGAKPLFPAQETRWGKAQEVLQRLVLSMGVAVLIFFVYFMAKGNKDVILFNFPLDPSQCLPAFLIGSFVGIRPDFYFNLIKKPPGQSGTTVPVLLLVLLGATAPLAAQSGSRAGLRPVDLDFDAAANNLYVLNSPTNRIDRIALPSATLRTLARIDPDGTASSQCLLRWNSRFWVATLSSRLLSGGSGLWRVTLSLTGIDHSQSVSQKFTGYGQFHGIDCDAEHQRLLVADRLRDAIYAIPLLQGGLGKPVMLVRNVWLREPVALVSRGDNLFVAVRGRRAVVQVNLQTGEVRPLVEDLSDPTDVVLTPDASRLLVVDAGKARILEHDLRSGVTRERLGGVHLREPRAVQMDHQGNLWVADSWIGVLEFAPNEKTPRRRIR